MSTLYIIDLHYVKSLDDVDKHKPEHVLFLEKFYREGLFICSGPKNPRTGGIIIARADTRDILEKVIEEDPFHQYQVAKYEIIEFDPVMSSDALVLNNET